jgi:prepilin-type processing-associated H-X9-DG protein
VVESGRARRRRGRKWDYYAGKKGDFSPNTTGDLPAIRRFALDRHMGGVQVAFADSSVGFVGIKSLWKLQWHKNYKLYKEPAWPNWMASMNK